MQRIIDLFLSVVAAIVGIALSWPFWRDFEYWPESGIAWQIYFLLGFVLAVYVFYVFLGAVRTLFLHDAWSREAREAKAESAESNMP